MKRFKKRLPGRRKLIRWVLSWHLKTLTFQNLYWLVKNYKLGLRWVNNLANDIAFYIFLCPSFVGLRTSFFLYKTSFIFLIIKKWVMTHQTLKRWVSSDPLKCGSTRHEHLVRTWGLKILKINLNLVNVKNVCLFDFTH